MNEENKSILEMSEEELLQEYVMACDPDCNLDITPLEQSHRIAKSKQELLNRLSKNSVEEFKKKLIEDIENISTLNSKDVKDETGEYNKPSRVFKREVLDLII